MQMGFNGYLSYRSGLARAERPGCRRAAKAQQIAGQIGLFGTNFRLCSRATTSSAASSALSEKVWSGQPGATKRHLNVISSGRSKYPSDLLKDAGVDMTTDEPLQLTVRKMNRIIDEIEKLLPPTNEK
jgi:hypothetical protein